MADPNALKGKRILIVATDGFEQAELTEPRDQLSAAGAEIVIAGLKPGKIKGWDETDWGDEVEVDTVIAKVDARDYDAIVLPGGQINPDTLRVEADALDLIRAFDAAGKPIAAICHAPWLLIEAGLVKGKRLTSFESIRTDLSNAGAEVVNEAVVVDGHIVTSRCPDDLDAFCGKIVELVGARAGAEV